MNIITMDTIYYVLGIIVAFIAVRIAFDREHPNRFGSSLFWALFAVTFLFGNVIPSFYVGCIVLVMVVLASLNKVTKSEEKEVPVQERVKHAEKLKNKIFMPAILIPIFTIIGTLTLGKIKWGNVALVDPDKVTLVALALGALLAFIAAMRITKAKITTPVQEGSRLLQAVGWAVILPQMLAALGGIFAKSGVGQVVSDLVGQVLPTEYPFVAVMVLLFRNDAIYSRNGECIRSVCSNHWWNRLTFNCANARRKPSNYGSTRYVCWILRNVAYSNGSKL